MDTFHYFSLAPPQNCSHVDLVVLATPFQLLHNNVFQTILIAAVHEKLFI